MTADLKPSVDPCMHGGTVMGGQCLLRSQAHETHLLCIHFLILIRTFWGITVPILQMGMLRSRWKCSTTEIRMWVFLGPGFPGGTVVQNQLPMQEIQETGVWSLGWEDPLEEGMATHSSNLAWRIPWTEEPGRLQSIASQTVGHDWRDLACMHPWVQWALKQFPWLPLQGGGCWCLQQAFSKAPQFHGWTLLPEFLFQNS